jgi:Fe2+ transport system protein FeoA
MGFRFRHGRQSRPRRMRRALRSISRPRLLCDWHPGEDGIITAVAGSSLLAARLRELGVIPGHLIRVLRSGPPLIVQVGGGRFGMRRQDAAAVRVSPLTACQA